jgi:Ca2+-binding EF-hand superfamily protein
MKSGILLASLAVAVLAAWSTPLLAADDAAGKGDKGGAFRAKLLEKFDTNGDGKLDDQERAAARDAFKEKIAKFKEALKGKILKKLDTNGDGKLDDKERSAAKATFAEKKAEWIKKFDKNGDGKLDDTERAAARAAFWERLRARRR